jgi:hypothetical protein
MQKRTSYEFEGKCGYSYVTKAYSSSDVKFEVHFRASENDVDTVQFGLDENSARSILRSLTRAVMESNQELGVTCLQDIIDEHKEKLEQSSDCEE